MTSSTTPSSLADREPLSGAIFGRQTAAHERRTCGPREISCVKLADRITNLEPPPPHWPIEKRVGYLEEAHVIADKLAGASALLERSHSQQDRRAT